MLWLGYQQSTKKMQCDGRKASFEQLELEQNECQFQCAWCVGEKLDLLQDTWH